MPDAKRALDLCLVGLLAPLLVPIGALIALAVLLDSPGSAFYRAQRIGRDGAPFEMFKFRTMKVGVGGHALAGAGDTRITPVGSFLRTTRLDELPQLWNVLRGEMSFVGPRPELAQFVEDHAGDYEEILTVPPGITGSTQLRYAGAEARLLGMHEDPEAYYRDHLLPDKVACDLAYARTRSLAGDAWLLLVTLVLPAVLVGQSLRSEGPERVGGGPVLACIGGLAMACVVLLAFSLGPGSPR